MWLEVLDTVEEMKGQLLVDYCKEKRFVIRSTFGAQAKKRRHSYMD